MRPKIDKKRDKCAVQADSKSVLKRVELKRSGMALFMESVKPNQYGGYLDQQDVSDVNFEREDLIHSQLSTVFRVID